VSAKPVTQQREWFVIQLCLELLMMARMAKTNTFNALILIVIHLRLVQIKTEMLRILKIVCVAIQYALRENFVVNL